MVGRRIWFWNEVDTVGSWVGPIHVLSFRKVLPQGVYEHPYDGSIVERKRTLIQINTDPGGIRTLAVADVWLRDPGRNAKPV